MQSLSSYYFDVPALRPGTLGAYGLALLCATAATALRIAIDPFVMGVQFITFFPAVITTALLSGFRAGVLCTVFSAAEATFFVLEPRLSFVVENPRDVLDLLLFILVALLNVIIITGMRSAIEHYRELRQTLEERVEERGAELADVRERLQHEATFRAMFNISSVGKVEVDPETCRFLRANDAMCKFVGYSESELLARTVFDITHPDYLARDRELFQSLVAGKSDFDVEKRYIRKDGKSVWARTTVNVIRDESGRPWRNTAVIQDITERKEREERERVLIREINHRAKNLLSVVEAIARQTAAKDPEHFLESFGERLQALSANQDLLVRNQWQGVDVGDLVRAQLPHFLDLIGSRIVVDGPKLRLKVAGAQAIGLALHELVS